MDAALAALAGRQHGVVSLRQARDAGLSIDAIERRVRTGRLHPVHRGVYAVGHGAIGRRGEILAAVLACGPGAVASHRSAGELLGLYDRSTTVFDVSSSNQAGRGLAGIRWHRRAELPTSDITLVDGVPSTNASRTLVDLAGMLGDRSLRSAVEHAAVRRALDVGEVEGILARGRRRGAPRLRQLLTPWSDLGGRTRKLRSPLEARLLAAIAESGLPRPECNVALELDGELLEIDLLWAEHRVVIETDGERFHGTPSAFNRDRRRDQVLGAAGYRSARVTWLQMEREPSEVVERIGRMLGRPA